VGGGPHGPPGRRGEPGRSPLRKCLAGFALCLALACPALADDPFLDEFLRVALGREYSFDRASAGRLIRWAQPVRITGFGDQRPAWEPQLAAYVGELARITGHDLRYARSGPAEFAVIFVPSLRVSEIERYAVVLRQVFVSEAALRAHFDRLANGTLRAACFANLRVDRQWRIVGAVAVIPLDQGPRVLRQCIVEELAQSLGLPNDVNDLTDTIFSDRTPEIELTAKDRRFLRLLYHPALRPGMTGAEIVQAVAAYRLLGQ
jgi:hypothetical protein